ncbi:MAG: DNA cytosine methyltransferase [Chloroflexota bacterium]
MANIAPARLNIGLDLSAEVIDTARTAICGEGRQYEFIQGDALEWLKQYPWSGNEFVYLDPPYLLETRTCQRDLYDHEFYTEAQHTELLTLVKSIPAKVMISGYWSELYANLLADWHTVSYQAITRGGTMATEWLWMNYPEPVELHDYRWLGDNYRERERIKRKRQRWIKNLRKMDLLERRGLLSAMAEVFGRNKAKPLTISSPGGHKNRLILSLFPGIGLLDKAFEQLGFCVVRGPDEIFGGDIRQFFPPPGVFWGVIGGSPCQDFSSKRRCPPTGYGQAMLDEFKRVVEATEPEWFLLENVPRMPDVEWPGDYKTQRFEINQSWYEPVSRLRHIQFGSRSGGLLNVTGSAGNVTDGAALAHDDRPFKELVRLQGLPEDFDIPSFNLEGKKEAVGNGVPLSIGRALAAAVVETFTPGPVTHSLDFSQDLSQKHCACGCGRPVSGRASYHSTTCRKRAQRRRENVKSSD